MLEPCTIERESCTNKPCYIVTDWETHYFLYLPWYYNAAWASFNIKQYCSKVWVTKPCTIVINVHTSAMHNPDDLPSSVISEYTVVTYTVVTLVHLGIRIVDCAACKHLHSH